MLVAQGLNFIVKLVFLCSHLVTSLLQSFLFLGSLGTKGIFLIFECGNLSLLLSKIGSSPLNFGHELTTLFVELVGLLLKLSLVGGLRLGQGLLVLGEVVV